MTILIGGREPQSVVYTFPGGRRPVRSIYVGDKYVWPKIQPRKSAVVSDTGERYVRSFTIPWWVASIDLVLLGAGGGGAGGDGALGRSGKAGSPGQWKGFTITRAPGEPSTLGFDINAGGSGGAPGSSGGAGGPTIATFEGSTYTASGGAGGAGYGSAGSGVNPGNFTWNGTQWTPNPSLDYMRQGYGGTGGAGGTFGRSDPGEPGTSGIVYLYLYPSPEAQA